MKILTSEVVFPGHPDKICDQISEAILDECLRQDIDSRVAVEVMIKDNLIVIGGEITTKAKINYKKVVAKVLKHIGLKEKFKVLVKVSKQSSDIAQGVDLPSVNGAYLGAGDQGIVYGYANSEGDSLPLPYRYAKEIAWSMIELQHDLPDIFGVDGKCQVSIKYDDNNKPVHITTIVVSQQTRKGIKREAYYPIIKQAILRLFECIYLLDEDTRILINPTGKFEVSGSYADCGVTGRKIACDLYGGLGRTQGGNLNGKDLSKVDKLGAYFTRLVALAFVQAELAKECEVQVAYAIGEDAPVAVYVTSLNTGVYSDDVLTQAAKAFFDFTPICMKNTLFPDDSLKNRVSDTLNEVGYFEYFAAHGHTGFGTPGDYAIRYMSLGKLVEITKVIAGDSINSAYDDIKCEDWGTPMISPDIDSVHMPTLTCDDLPYVESKGRGRPKGSKDSKKRKSRKKTTK